MGRVKKFAKFMRVRLVERCPFMKSAQASQIHDFSMLKKSGAEFCFSKDLVCKAAHVHFAIHERHYGGLSEEHFVKFFLRVYHRLAKAAHQRAIYDEGSCLPCSCRRTSGTARTYAYTAWYWKSRVPTVWTVSRNRLASHHFVSCMWMSLSVTPDRDVVSAHWAQSNALREVLVRAVKRDSAGHLYIPNLTKTNSQTLISNRIMRKAMRMITITRWYKRVAFWYRKTGVRMTRLFRHTIFAYINHNLNNTVELG